MMQLIDDKTVVAILQTLFKELKNGVERNEYYIFPPESVEIRARGKICFDKEETAKDLRESLQELGKTVHKLVTGETYRAGQDSRQQTESISLWYFILLLLSGNLYSIPKVEILLNDLRKEQSRWYRLLDATRRAGAKFIRGIFSVIKFFVFLPVRFAKLIYRIFCASIATLCVLLYIGEVAAYIKFNWLFSGGLAMGISVGVGAIAIGMLCLHDDIRSVYRIPLFVFLNTFLLIALSFWSPMVESFADGDGDRTCVVDNAVIVDRKTGKFVARLPLTEDDKTLVWDSYIINHLKYKVVPGLPLSNSSFDITLNIPINGKIIYVFTGTVNYVIEGKSYPIIFNTYGGGKDFYNAIKQKIAKDIQPKLAQRANILIDRYDVPMEDLQSTRFSIIPTGAALAQRSDYYRRFEKELRGYFEEELSKMNIIGITEER